MSNRFIQLRKVETLISTLLQTGVLLCSSILILGMFFALILPHPKGFGAHELTFLLSGSADGIVFDPPKTFDGLSKSFEVLDAGAMICIGIVLLIALPILRVAMSAVLFLIQKDYLYLFFSLLVLGILSAGIYFGYNL